MKKFIDYAALKAEFILSNYETTLEFLESKFDKVTDYMIARTSYWGRSREIARAHLASSALKKAMEGREDRMKTLFEKMQDKLIELVGQLERDEMVSPKEFELIWKLVRTECGMPTNITKNENVDIDSLEKARVSLDNRLNTNAKKPATRKGKGAKAVSKRKVKK